MTPPQTEADTGAGGDSGVVRGLAAVVVANEQQVRTYLNGNINKRSL